MSAALLVFTTFASSNEASRVAETLVQEGLAACASQSSSVSTYRWEGKIERSEEVSMVLKTTQGAFPALQERLLALHSYDCPEILAMPVSDGHPGYLDWLRASVRSPR